MYTTTIDYGRISSADMDKASALESELARLADTSNKHLLEERGLRALREKDETGLYQDEEMLYSGVERKIGKGKFTCFNQKHKTGALVSMQSAFLNR